MKELILFITGAMFGGGVSFLFFCIINSGRIKSSDNGENDNV